ncbi:hypothetical protein, partial [Alistipes putredinis]|uniref:hypothetical protein n=1 Tax=Alistipes putredinis TaxID=28117 RepID=UPI003A8B4048
CFLLFRNAKIRYFFEFLRPFPILSLPLPKKRRFSRQASGSGSLHPPPASMRPEKMPGQQQTCRKAGFHRPLPSDILKR